MFGRVAAAFSNDLLPQRRHSDRHEYDREMVRYRKVAYRYVLIAIAIMLGPIDAHNYYSGNYIPAAAGLLVLCLFLITIYQLSQNKEPFLSAPTVLFITVGLVILSLLYGQSYNLYWVYPLLVALPVLLKTRVAIWLAILVGLIVTPFVWMRFDTNTAIIVCLSMAHTWLISAWLMYAVSQQSRRLTELAVTDPLTGALNRRRLKAEAKEAIQAWQRHKRHSSLLLIDVDHFKRVNDELGHDAGDAAICQLVEFLSHRLRRLDHVFRYGGEEFVVLLAETDEAQALHVAEELRAFVERTDILPGRRITVSMGVSGVSQSDSVDHWLKLCDRALYQAKNDGRNRVVVASAA
jgi:diguanylate cyclase (GGDEF)-like protein